MKCPFCQQEYIITQDDFCFGQQRCVCRNPKEFRWKAKDCGPGVGLIDFDWTNDIKKAKLWGKRFIVEGIAMEYCNTEIIAVTGTESKAYKVIKEQK